MPIDKKDASMIFLDFDEKNHLHILDFMVWRPLRVDWCVFHSKGCEQSMGYVSNQSTQERRKHVSLQRTHQQRTTPQMKQIFIFGIRFYRVIFFPIRILKLCRFEPSCSEYGIQAIQKHGAMKGSWLAIKRIARCNPFHCGGHDPVPEK